jgi:hypothetical protein
MPAIAGSGICTGVRPATGAITWKNRWDHILARLGMRRSHHRVEPGLYALGKPNPDSPVLLSANYTLSFDALRSAVEGVDAYILVLDTKGINVWCAAGKGTFGAEEILHRIEATGLADMVRHRTLILPQLGAPGVAVHEVKSRSGFRIEWGPARASDLPEYLETGRATSEMRRVNFGLADRAVLIPVEAVHILFPLFIIIAALRLTGIVGHWYNDAVAGVLAGTVLFPLLLPLIPTKDFSSKGFILGIFASAPLILRDFLGYSGIPWWRLAAGTLSHLLIVSSISAFICLNFTGSSTFTSRSGVRREIFRYIPAMAWAFGTGIAVRILLWIL